jgi:Protein of unknown function (DUF2971)
MADKGKAGSPTEPLPAVLQVAIDKFSAWAVQHLKAEEGKNTITAPLYHYTDGRGLKGIIESGRVWFTDYRHMNDPSELIHGIDMAQDVARLLTTGADGRIGLFLECFKDIFRHANFESRLEFYIASFSRSRDDLGQWRAYADNGRGFAIGFSPRMFKIVDKPLPDELHNFVGPVLYSIGDVCARHHSALDEAANIFLQAVDEHAELVRDKTIGIPFMQAFVHEVIVQPLIWNCLTSKHPAYEHEQEVRLIIMGMAARLAPYVTTRLRGSEIVPYIAHPMPLRESHNIVEIVVGPAAPPDVERTVRMMLNSLGVDPNVEVSRSDIPYRAL